MVHVWTPGVCVCVCVCLRVCVRERERDRECLCVRNLCMRVYANLIHTHCQRASATSAGFRTHDNAEELAEFPKIL